MTIDELKYTEKEVMSQLKDFQRATVERVDYLFRHQQNRVLVADEVGLGKTLIAKGVIAKTAKLRYEEHHKIFKVVYVCSNQNIAKQNLPKLDVFRYGIDKYSGYRLSMQFYAIKKRDNEMMYEGQYVQLLTLTPETSFSQRGGQGRMEERMLLTAILFQIIDNDEKIADKRHFYKQRLVDINGKGSRTWFYNFDKWINEVDYLFPWKSKVHKSILGDKSFMPMVYNFLENENGFRSNSAFIGFIRQKFAFLSVQMLNPDLVIMDEFQRFKFLIDNENQDSDAALLARCFLTPFDKKSVQSAIRVLLLSATPYKLFSTLDEIGDDNVDEHFSEFMQVVKFLYDDKTKYSDFETVWSNYSVSLKLLKNDDVSILNLQQNVHLAEEKLYGCMCRTERISVMDSADYVDDSSKRNYLDINEFDINSYREIVSLIHKTEIQPKFTVDFVKSSPYILSFMQDYNLKQKLEDYFEKHSDNLYFAQNKLLWLNKKAVVKYEKLLQTNARFARLIDVVFENSANYKNNSSLFLWVPPSMPYYKFGGVYQDSEGFSKILIFSAWKMVPKMIASLVSYEEERLTIGNLIREKNREGKKISSNYFANYRYPQSRLPFSQESILTLLYPSKFLSSIFNPVFSQGLSTLAEVEKNLYKIIEEKLQPFLDKYEAKNGSVDYSWYWAAPMMIDGSLYTMQWLDYMRTSKNNAVQLNTLYQKVDNKISKKTFGKCPDKKDLINTMVNMTLGSPAVCVYRNLKNYKVATNVAFQFRNYFNTPEHTAIIELSVTQKKYEDNNHWQDILVYCKNANFQAMIDEYIHLLRDIDKDDLSKIEMAFSEALSLNTATLYVDSYADFCDKILSTGKQSQGMRTHYAVAFVNGSSTEKNVARKDSIRNTFNSPFWPFVLASTSIGQEGLDFHLYCRKIMHWNLPCNPIDLEQREGRINRFKCLAIRQNLARKYAATVNFSLNKDAWEQMFDAAHNDKPEGVSDLIPFWCFGKDQDIKIERLLACYPFSRDESSYERLSKILSLYRLTLGQPRQEELLEYVFREFGDGDGEILKQLFIDLSPFTHNKK